MSEKQFTEIFELLGIFLAGTTFAAKAIPALSRFLTVFRVSFFFYSLLSEYLKRHPEKKKQLNILIASMTQHYLTTHPLGQKLAQESDIDEKVELVLKHDHEVIGVG